MSDFMAGSIQSPWAWLCGLITVLIIGVFIRKLNISRWLWFGLGILILSGIAALKFLDSEIFWGVFIASLLGFLGSVFVEKWLEEKANLKAKADTKAENSRVILIIRHEIEGNSKMAEDIRDYLQKASTVDGATFVNRPDDCFFYRFQVTSKESLWDRFASAVPDTSSLDQVANLYFKYQYLNNILFQASAFISSRLTLGSVAGDYRTAVTALPWSNQLNNNLSKLIEESIAVLRKLTT